MVTLDGKTKIYAEVDKRDAEKMIQGIHNYISKGMRLVSVNELMSPLYVDDFQK